MIFEGDVSSTTIVEKMSLCEQNGIDIYVMVVNPTPELAQRNVISRRSEAGRGASGRVSYPQERSFSHRISVVRDQRSGR